MIFNTLTGAVYVNAANGKNNAHLGRLKISKNVSGTGVPDNDTDFEFTVTKDDVTAVGKYKIDDSTEQEITKDGKIKLKAGQSAVLTELEAGEYTVTETVPSQKNYKSTSFSINNGSANNGCSAVVNVKEPEASDIGGWEMKNGNLIKDDDGYFTYTLTSSQIDSDGNIIVDCDTLSEYMESEMRDYQNYTSVGFKVKFVNKTGGTVKYKDYKFDTVNWLPAGEEYIPSSNPAILNTNEGSSSTSAGYGWGEVWQELYPMLIGKKVSSSTLSAEGFDGNKIRVAMAPLRCINPAVISYFKSNPGKGNLTGNSSTNSASYVTLLQMNAFPNLIKEEFSFENWEGKKITLPADSSRTYADFICAFYGVPSLDELTVAQKYNVLGTGSKGSIAMPYDGQSNIWTYYSNSVGKMQNWCIPYTALNDGTLDYYKTWGVSGNRIESGKKLISGGQEFSEEDAKTYAYQPNYYLMESDSDMLSMAYEYLYERCMRFTFDKDNRPISTSIDNSAVSNSSVGGIKDYIDRNDEASANVLAAMNGGKEISDGESIKLDKIRGYIEVPNAWSLFHYYDFGFKLIFKAESPKTETASVLFINTYKDNTRNDNNTPEPPANTDNDKKDIESPKTEDNSNLPLYGTLAIIAFVGLGVVLKKKRVS